MRHRHPIRRAFPYGLDAPPLVAIFCGLALLFWAIALLDAARLLPMRITGTLWGGLAFACSAGGMIWSSARGKLRTRERLLDLLTWRGDERVLDVGCGTGLMAVAAARRVPHGKVQGVDIWQAKDLSDNAPDGFLANARREGVAARVSATTADMRALPFPDAAFERITSRYAIHNIWGAGERARAIAEIARVLAPGGSAVICDILYLNAYARLLRRDGCSVQIRRSIADIMLVIVSLGMARQGILVVTRPARSVPSMP